MNKKRLTNISTLLADYSKGNFSKTMEVSDELDEIDSIIMGINMLGEELKETTISKNIFENIFNSVSNILFIVNKNGVIVGTNNYGKKFNSIRINKTLFSDICNIKRVENAFNYLVKHKGTKIESELTTSTDKKIFTEISIVRFSHPAKYEEDNFLIIAEDITEKKEHDLQIIKAIIKTQEVERQRVADDLHDSLGQELSSIRMMLSAINREAISPSNIDIINTCNSVLMSSITELREICFDLMPASLASSDLLAIIKELLSATLIKVKYSTNSKKLPLNKEETLAVYRVFQEFINNSTKYSKAKLLTINFNLKGDKLEINLSDDGVGFNMKSTHWKGRGLMTMKNRIHSINGHFSFDSIIGEGTHLKIIITCKN